MGQPHTRHKKQNDDAKEAMSWAVEKMRDLRRSIQKATGKVEEGWFGNLLLGILNCALLDYYSVNLGAEKSVYLAAWACRNLLELKVITTYALASKDNASRFRSELVIDAKEFYEAMTKHHRASHKKLLSMLSEMSQTEKGPVKEMLQQALRKESERGAETGATDSEAAIYSRLMVDFGLEETARPKRISQIARLVNQSEDFDPSSRFAQRSCTEQSCRLHLLLRREASML